MLKLNYLAKSESNLKFKDGFETNSQVINQ